MSSDIASDFLPPSGGTEAHDANSRTSASALTSRPNPTGSRQAFSFSESSLAPSRNGLRLLESPIPRPGQ